MTKPAVPTEILRSVAIAFNTPIGKNSLVTSAKAVTATVNSAIQLPLEEGVAGEVL